MTAPALAPLAAVAEYQESPGAATCCVKNCERPAAEGIARCRYHERRRLAQIHVQPVLSDRCVKRIGRGTCGAQLVGRVDHTLGTVTVVCPACERQAAGICADCPASTPSRARRRCARCAHNRQRAQQRMWGHAHRTEVSRQAKKRYLQKRQDAAWRQRQAEYRREYQSGDWWRVYQREWSRQQRARNNQEAAA